MLFFLLHLLNTHSDAQKIYKPDLEEYDTTIISHYYGWNCSRPLYMLKSDSSIHYSGKKCLLLYPIYDLIDSGKTIVIYPADSFYYKDTLFWDSTIPTNKYGSFGLIIPDKFVRRIKYVKVKIFVHTEFNTGDSIELFCVFGNRGMGLIKSDRLTIHKVETCNNIKWSEYSCISKLPKNAKHVGFIAFTNGHGKAYFDNLTFIGVRNKKNL